MERLSNREMQVLKLTAYDCLSAKEVADKLCISTTTAQNHIKNIKEKLNLQKVSELCKYYYINIYACILLLVITPTIFIPNANARARRRANITRQATARRNELDFEFDYLIN
ncbi:Bacterial regulatory protein, luxR family [anaerobic digester metagenome]